MHSKCLSLFSFEFGGGREDFFSFFFCSEHVPSMFFASSQWVPIRFRMCSPKVFPVATHFNPICFGQSRPLLTYIVGERGGIPCLDKMFYFGEAP
jgi:hypothetical protein